MIVETYLLTATNNDVLAAGTSRLASIPYNGRLILEMQCNSNDGTNNFQCTIQLPDGETPLEDVLVPTGPSGGALNADDKYTVAFDVSQGGHVTVQMTENGTAIAFLRATLMP